MINKSKVALFCILFLGLFLRLYGNNWDQGWHLHPDERFLTMVGVAVRIPSSLIQYLDQHTSSFNPVNRGNAFFVYGTFPILINKIVAQVFSNDTYEYFNLQGRVLAGIADFIVILVIYKLVELGEKKLKLSSYVKYYSAFFYALAVLPIQLSHFFTVDTFLNLFCWLSFYFSVQLNVQSSKRMLRLRDLALSGLFLGLAVACKVSAIYFAPLVGVFILAALFFKKSSSIKSRTFIFALVGSLLFAVCGYIALRFAAPYYFETNSIVNLKLSTTFLNNIETLKLYNNPEVLFPPSNQWIHASSFFSLINLVFFGVGPMYFLLAIGGVFILLKTRKNILILLVLIWIGGFTVYQSVQFAKSMRYLLFIYPFLAIFAGIGITFLFEKLNKATSRFLYLFISSFVSISIVVWPLAFISIYTKDHSRVTASKWIFAHIPRDSKLTYEYWDDPLPLTVQDPATRNYILSEIHIFDPDTNEKWKKINDQLSKVDYYIMSSNRGWGSIPTTPERYPSASKFYKKMFDGTGDFTLIKEISSYPSLRYLGIPLDFPDQWSEEAFTVYDHPQVLVFKKKDK